MEISLLIFAYQKYSTPMILQERIEILQKLGAYMLSNDPDWASAKQKATAANAWFIPQFIEVACENIATNYLDKNKLEAWIEHYQVPEQNLTPATIGIVMAGNIPLVGFHDFLACCITGNYMQLKLSEKDKVLWLHILDKLYGWAPELRAQIEVAGLLKNCTAYIATGSNNTARYFEYYFAKYPHIIRKNRTSIAILTGNETEDDLKNLAYDITLYFGMGCRNITHLLLPPRYNMEKLVRALQAYDHLLDYHKYKHNYDYQLTILIMNNKTYTNTGSFILTHSESIYAPISLINYSYYQDKKEIETIVSANRESIQTVVGQGYTPFGKAQTPSLFDYADGVDTMRFLQKNLQKI